MRHFFGTLAAVWFAACVAAFLYARYTGLPKALVEALLPAVLAELAFYLLPGIESARKAFDRAGPPWFRALLLAVSAVTPYLIESVRLRNFAARAFLLLLALAAVAAFWYAVARPSTLADILFLAFMAAVYLSPAFRWIFPRPRPHLQLEVLGHLMWIRLGILAVLSLRRLENVRFGFIPNSSEWSIGIQQFVFFAPVGAVAGYFLRFARFHPAPLVWWKFPLFAVGVFLGTLWVVALAEEFLFRGFLLQFISKRAHSQALGVVLSSALFGAVHLAHYRWPFALLAGIAGIFYAIAFLRARSLRAAMVTHALVVTVWRALFSA